MARLRAEDSAADELIPARPTLPALRDAVTHCKACDLWRDGRDFKVSKERGVRVDSDLAPVLMATVHPSSILRARDEEARQEALGGLISDLKAASRAMRSA